MEVQGFVSKNQRLGKMQYRKWAWQRYHSGAYGPQRPPVPLTCSSLYRPVRRSIPTVPRRTALFGYFLYRRLEPRRQNNIRSAPGTPLDSGRFGQAPPGSERNDVLTSIVVSIVRTCTRFAVPVVIFSLLLAVGAGFYTARNFAINTDINTLISPDLDWRKRDNQFGEAFDRDRLILAVVEAPTPELSSAAAKALTEKLSADKKNFESVTPLGAGEFFEKNGLLFLPAEEVGQITGQLESAAPLIEIMAGDPSIRGLTGALETGLAGIKRGQVKLDNAARPFNLISQTVEDVLKKGDATFSWRELVDDKPLTDADKRAFNEFKPNLDYQALEPGKTATDAIRQAAADLNFAGAYNARVRLTGPVP